MSKSTEKMIVQLTDQQVRILAEAARMGLPEMIVRLSAISATVKIAQFAIKAFAPNKQPAEIHFTQNNHGDPQNLDTQTLKDYTKDFLKREAGSIVVDVTRNAMGYSDTETVKGETVESENQEEDTSAGQQLPKTEFNIPNQPRADDQP